MSANAFIWIYVLSCGMPAFMSVREYRRVEYYSLKDLVGSVLATITPLVNTVATCTALHILSGEFSDWAETVWIKHPNKKERK